MKQADCHWQQFICKAVLLVRLSLAGAITSYSSFMKKITLTYSSCMCVKCIDFLCIVHAWWGTKGVYGILMSPKRSGKEA